MKGFWLAIAWTCASCFGNSRLVAEDAPSPDEVLARWQAAFRNCRSFQAAVTSSVHDLHFDKSDETRTGQFYYEAPGNGRFQIGDDVYVWLHGDVFVARDESKYWQVTAAFLEKVRQEVLELERRPQWFGSIKVQLYRTFAQPTGPVFLAPWQGQEEAWRARYDLSTWMSSGNVMLTGVAKSERFNGGPTEWSVAIDAKTNLPWAVETYFGRPHRHVLFFSDVRLNETPSHRNQLLSLDHPEWPVEVFDYLTEDELAD